MLNNQEWHQLNAEFVTQAQVLLGKSEECLSHLELIVNDKDAIDCLQDTLRSLTNTANQAAVACVADFSRQLQEVLQLACPGIHLQGEALETLKNCITLLAWQVELIDPQTGQLPLDDSEQQALLEKLEMTANPGRIGKPSGVELSNASSC